MRVAARASEMDRIYAEHHSRILRFLTRLIGPKDAEDLAQEVFIKADRAWATFRGESQVSTWLFRIAAHSATDRLRKPALRQETFVKEFAAEARQTSLEELALRKATNECIRDVIDGLSEKYRIPLILSELEGFTNREIAEILGISLETAKVRLHRAKAQLKRALIQACEFSRDERNELTCDPIKE